LRRLAARTLSLWGGRGNKREKRAFVSDNDEQKDSFTRNTKPIHIRGKGTWKKKTATSKKKNLFGGEGLKSIRVELSFDGGKWTDSVKNPNTAPGNTSKLQKPVLARFGKTNHVSLEGEAILIDIRKNQV